MTIRESNIYLLGWFKMIRKLLSSIIIFSFINIYPLTAAAETKGVDCSKTWEDGSAEKNFCMIEDRKLANKGGSFAQLGRNSLETLTILLASMTSMTLITNKSSEAEKKQHVVYFANKLTPYLLLGGSLLLIFAEVESAFSFKKDCSDLLNASGSNLATKIDAIVKKDKKGDGGSAMLTTQCNADTLKVDETQLSDMCRAKACTVRMKIAAAKKVKHLGWAKMAYMAATSMELLNMLSNMVKGGIATATATTYTTTSTTFNTLGTAAAASVYGAAGAPALFLKAEYWAGEALNENRKASDHYGYPEGTDAKVQDPGVMSHYRKSNTFNYVVKHDSSEKIIEDQVILQMMYEKHRQAMITQLGSSATFMETAFLIDDYENLIKGRTHSLSVKEFEKVKNANIPFTEQYEGMNKLIQMSYQLGSNLGIQNAQAGFNMTEVMNTLGLAAGISLPLLLATKKGVTQLIKKAWTKPITRVAYIGALTAMIYLDEKLYKDNIVKTLDERAATFDEKIEALAANGAITTESGITSGPEITFTPPAIPTPPKTPKLGKDDPAPCVTGDLEQDKACECLKSNTCHDMKMPQVAMPPGVTVPSSVSSAMKNLMNTANAHAKGDYAKADLNGSNLSSGLAAITVDNNKLKKKLDEEMKKAKLAPLDIDEKSKKMQKEILSAVATAMGMPAPSGSSSAPSLGSAGGDSSKKADEKVAPAQTINSSTAGSGGGAAGATDTAKTDDLGLGLEELGKDELGKLDEEGKVAGLDAYEFKAEDISKKSDENLFKNISSRYLKTAYPVLLQELKTEPVQKDK